MTEQEKQRQIDALVERIDAFMKTAGAACASPAARASAGDPLRRLLRRRRGRSLQRTGQTGRA